MRYLRTNTACRITVGPFFDKTDGITPEVALTVTNCKLTLMVDDGNVPTLVLDAAATASGGNNDMVHVTNDDAGFYDLELTQAQTNYLGRAMLAITDAANHCPVSHELMILPANVYDSLVLGTDLLDANASQLGGTSQTGRDVGASVLLSSGTGTGQISLASGAVTAGTVSDKTGYALSSAGVQAIWDALTSALTTVGSIGKKLADWVIGTTQTGDAFARLGAPAGASIAADIAAVKAETAAIVADTNELQTDITNGGRVDLLIDAIKAKTDNLPASPAATGDIPTAAAIKTEVEASTKLLQKTVASTTNLVAVSADNKVSANASVVLTADDIQDIVDGVVAGLGDPKELRDGNIRKTFVVATAENATRKVAVGVLDYVKIEVKADAASDWSAPTSTKYLYFWYSALGNTNPTKLGENNA